MYSFHTFYPYIIRVTLILFLLSNATKAYSCNEAQMLDFDYRINEPLGNGYSTFGRLWLLDNKPSCINSLKYGACITLNPMGDFANVNIEIIKDKGTSSSYSQKIKYNSSQVIRYDTMSMDVYLKLYISNTIADFKMSGKSCDSGFPNIPRQVTRQELDNMYRG